MKRDNHPLLLPALVALLAYALLGGCADTPSKRWAQEAVALGQAEHTLTSINKTGLLSDKDFVATNTGVQAARAALNASAPLMDKGGNAFETYLAIVQAVVNKVVELQAEASQKVAAPPPVVVTPVPAPAPVVIPAPSSSPPPAPPAKGTSP